MKYTNVFFDLDGTITEPALGITNALIYALEKFDIRVEDRTTLYKFIGPPLRDSFAQFYGFNEEQTLYAIGYYREYYSVNGIKENELMPGMRKSLEYLKNNGAKLYVATSKPELFAKQILEHLGVAGYFDIIAGATMDEKRTKKTEILEYLLDETQIGDSERALRKTVMVGDRHFDILGAKHFGMDSIGVLFGYGSREELSEAGATYLAADAAEMCRYIIW